MIKIENLSASYNGTDIIHNISFEVKNGENLSIIGPNGCGKTTLLRAIAGIIKSSGKILINSESTRKMGRKQIASQIALLSQINSINFSFTVLETVMLGRYLYMKDNFLSRPSKNDFEIVDEILETLKLSDIKNKQVNRLSGGQVQRIFLAKVLAQNPKIILLDEPTNHLDLSFQAELIAYLKDWSSKKDNLVIGVLHDISQAMALSNKFLLLSEGQVAAYGDKATVLTSENLKNVFKLDVVGYMQENFRLWKDVE